MTKPKPKPKTNSGQPQKTRRATAKFNMVARQAKVAELRRDGFTVREIAEQTGTSMPTIFSDLRALKSEYLDRSMGAIDIYRAEQAERRMSLIRAHLPIARDPENPDASKSAAIVHQNEQSLAKLLGLDSPELIHSLNEQAGTGGGVTLDVSEGTANIDWDAVRAEAETLRRQIDYKGTEESRASDE